ncbi:MAG: hypothetical protein ACKESB_02915, partial [Candidatus Hodgkinia cicadicola]
MSVWLKLIQIASLDWTTNVWFGEEERGGTEGRRAANGKTEEEGGEGEKTTFAITALPLIRIVCLEEGGEAGRRTGGVGEQRGERAARVWMGTWVWVHFSPFSFS